MQTSYMEALTDSASTCLPMKLPMLDAAVLASANLQPIFSRLLFCSPMITPALHPCCCRYCCCWSVLSSFLAANDSGSTVITPPNKFYDCCCCCCSLNCSSVAHARQLSLTDLLVSRPHQPLKLFPDDHVQWGPSPRTSQTGGTPSDTRPGTSGGTLGVTQVLQGGTASDTQAGTTGDIQGGTSGDTAAAAAATGRKPAAVQLPGTLTSPLMSPTVLQTPSRRDAYQRLRELVYSSDHIDPEYVLSKLGQGQLLEIRALMLERLGRHREALSVYIHDLKRIDLAEQYCDRVYEAGLAAATGVGPLVTVGGQGGTSGDTDREAAAGNSSDSAAAASGSQQATTTAASQDLQQQPTSNAAAAAAGTKRGLAGNSVPVGSMWGKVPKQQQQRQQQGKQRQQRPKNRQGQQAGRRLWPALPFGVQPQDIYMELVDAVLQVG